MSSLENLKIHFENPSDVFVSCIRSVIIPHQGEELFVSDFAAIEARQLFWLAEHEDGCQAFREGRKMYEEMASSIFGVDVDMVNKDQRFVGKTVILGAGYGMGPKKFQQACADVGREVSFKVATDAIKTYRSVHHFVPKLWSNIERAAVSAVEKKDKIFTINKTSWFMKGMFLTCKLPSGRFLYYCRPTVRYETTPWGDTKAVLYHWGVNSRTKKWEIQKTWGGTLVENIVQAVSRDIMAASMLRVEKAGYNVILTIHDEIVASRTIGEGDIEEFNKLMRTVPKWAKGSPVAVEGYKALRYKK